MTQSTNSTFPYLVRSTTTLNKSEAASTPPKNKKLSNSGTNAKTVDQVKLPLLPLHIKYHLG